MHIVFLSESEGGLDSQRGCLIRGLQLMKGIAANEHKVTLLLTSGSTKSFHPNINIFVGNRIKNLEQLAKKEKIDILYVRGRNLAIKIKKSSLNFIFVWNYTYIPTISKK